MCVFICTQSSFDTRDDTQKVFRSIFVMYSVIYVTYCLLQPFQTEYSSNHGYGKNIWIIVIYIYINAYVRINKLSTRSMFQPRLEEAEICGKPSHNSWLELRFIVLIEPSSVPESGIIVNTCRIIKQMCLQKTLNVKFSK